MIKHKRPLKELYLKNNNINEFGLRHLYKEYKAMKSDIFLDLFDKFRYTDESRLERTVWIYPVPDRAQILDLFKREECGIIIGHRVRKG